MRDEIRRLQEQLEQSQEKLKATTDDRDFWREEAMRLQAIVLEERWGLNAKDLTGYKASNYGRSSSTGSAMPSASTSAMPSTSPAGHTSAAAPDTGDDEEEGQWDGDVVWQEAVDAGKKGNKSS